jgi:hypothetical protein
MSAQTESSDRRFAAWPRWAAGAVLIAAVALAVLGLGHPYKPARTHWAMANTDVGFYNRVIDRMHHGQPYEQAAIVEQRASGYPVKPFIAIRPPLLAYILAALPSERVADILLAVLAALVVGAWAFRLKDVLPSPIWLAGVPLLVFTGVEASMTLQGMSRLHETWAGLLIALSLAVRTDRRFGLAVVLGLLAALIRELAMPYLLAMAVAALLEKRRAEAGAFAAALAVAIAALIWHGLAASLLLTANDPRSPGWLTTSGWPFVVATARWNFIALRAGPWVAAILLPLALLGAAGLKNGLGLRLLAVIAGYAAGFFFIGRTDNYYWGLITAPILAVSLCFSARAIGDLLGRIAAPTGS